MHNIDGINNHPNIRTMQLDWVDALSEDRKKRLGRRLGEINAEVIIGADIVSIEHKFIGTV